LPKKGGIFKTRLRMGALQRLAQGTSCVRETGKKKNGAIGASRKKAIPWTGGGKSEGRKNTELVSLPEPAWGRNTNRE